MTTMQFSKLMLRNGAFSNPRTSSGLAPEKIRELALHIGLHGLLNALLVTGDGLIIAGQRRYLAIEFLLQWFSDQPPQPRAQADDHPKFVEQFGKDGLDLSHAEISILEGRARELTRAGIPVRIIGGIGLKGVALADNLLREQLSSFEIASYLDGLHADGATGADLARLIGKSKAYVSRKLAMWKGAGPELRDQWEQGLLTDEVVQLLAALPVEKQRLELAGGPPKPRRGPANRPGIDTVKDLLDQVERREKAGDKYRTVNVVDHSYSAGVLDALRWVTGESASPEFARLAAEDPS